MFVAADWAAIESWLTAFFSKDERLFAVLTSSLNGGPKIHAVNAGLIYGIDPSDAKRHDIVLQGQTRKAYDGGKRLTHAWSYGMKPKTLAETFWIGRAEAQRIDTVLSGAYVGVAQYRRDLGESIWGVTTWDCPTHGIVLRQACCKTALYAGWDTPAAQVLYTPFGRRRFYLGRREEGLNAACAQRPQSVGADLWYETLCRLHGDGGWPLPECIEYSDPYALCSKGLVRVVTGTYDSFVVQTPRRHANEIKRWLLWTMEQPWQELGGWRFPAEIAIGRNWGKWDAINNPDGLKDEPYQPFSAVWP